MKLVDPIGRSPSEEPNGLIWTCSCVCNTHETYGGSRRKSLILGGTCFCSCFEGNQDNKDANLGQARWQY